MKPRLEHLLLPLLLPLAACSWLGLDSPVPSAQAPTAPMQDKPAPNAEQKRDALAALAQSAGLNWGAFPASPPDSPPPGARVLWVAPGGQGPGSRLKPLGSVAQALKQAQAGDWILLQGGLYQEGLQGDHISLRVQTPHLTLATVGAEPAVIQAANGQTYGVVIEASHVTLRNLKIQGFTANGLVLSSGKTTQKGITLQRVHVEMAPGNFNNGLLITENPALEGKPVLDGLRMEQVSLRNADLGFSCGRGPCVNLYMENVKVENRARQEGSGADALAVESGDNILIHDAEMTGASADGIDLKASRVLISGVHVHHNARNGIKLWNGGTLLNALVHHHGADTALSLNAPGDYHLAHVLVAYHNYQGPSSYVMTVGYQQPQPITLRMENSVFWRNAGGIYLSPDTQATISHTVMAESDNKKLLEQGERYVLVDQEDGLDAWGPGNRVLKRLELNQDFTLPPDSPLRDAGVLLKEEPVEDLKGQARVLGRAPDIGPLEMGP